jgi:predicted NBD/HSP70 family sugar kinase
MPARGSLGLLREQNSLRIVDALRLHGAASRADIARRTGLSRTTVSTLVSGLVDRGLVVERADDGAVSRDGQIGRPPVLLSLNPGAGAAVGLDFDHDKLRVAVSDLSRRILAETVRPCDVDTDAEGSIALAGTLVDELLHEAGVERDRVLGAGVGLAGPVDHDTGELHQSAVLVGWTGIDAAEALTARLGMPVHIDNDANLGALAELQFGAAAQAKYLAYVSISSGIGAGLIVDGRPYRGHRGTAGEIGHVLVDPSGPICRCGSRGCLETLASSPALLGLLRASRPDVETMAELIALAREGDVGCRRVLADAGRTIGTALASLVSLLGPDTVVLGGDVGEAGDLLLDPLREAVRRYAMPTATQDLRIIPGALGDRAIVLGALALVITQSDHAVAARIAEAVVA